MSEMVSIATHVTPITCATVLEARIRELRLIADEQPRYNVRSKRPAAQTWLTLTREHAPRLSVVRKPKDSEQLVFGPFNGRLAAQEAAEALAWVYQLRTCTGRIPRKPQAAAPAGCARLDLGRCPAPCRGGHETYASIVERATAVMLGDLRVIIASITAHLGTLSAQGRYEDAALWRDRLAALAQVSVRSHRLGGLRAIDELVAAIPTESGGWEIHVIRQGRLAGAAIAPAGTDPIPVVDAAIATAQTPVGAGPLTEETAALADWLEQPGVRLVRCSGALLMPVHCGGHLVEQLTAARKAAQTGGLEVDSVRHSGRPVGPAHWSITRMREPG